MQSRALPTEKSAVTGYRCFFSPSFAAGGGNWA
jgi:hypothetical protein